MSRPYPVGEKVAGHKLSSLYIIIIIITMLAGCTKANFIVCVLGSWGQLPMHAPFRMDFPRTHEEE